MNLPLDLTLLVCFLALVALVAALAVIWKSRSEREDELRYGRMRPTSQERLFRAPPLLDAWDPSGAPHRSEAFDLHNALR